eukprot:SAG11_NODE_131_length_15487_cov_5.744996_5_plen_189_part_00
MLQAGARPQLTSIEGELKKRDELHAAAITKLEEKLDRQQARTNALLHKLLDHADGVAAMRLFRSADDTLLNRTDMGMPWVAHATQGFVNYNSGVWNSTPVVPLGSQVMVTLSCRSMPRLPHIHHHRGTVPPKAQNAVGVDVLVDHSTDEWTRIGYTLTQGSYLWIRATQVRTAHPCPMRIKPQTPYQW